MWLIDSSEKANPSLGYINPSFGLFPTPYPRNAVPLNVLRRFYVMGIAVAKALQVSLSRHFLSILPTNLEGIRIVLF